MNFTEDKNLIKESIILNIDNHSFEFIVTCTIYGEILSVQNLFFELPEDAQRMMFGSKYESIKKKVFTHEQLLPYRVLLGYATKLSHPEQHIDRDFDDFIERIFDKKEQASIPKRTIDIGCLNSSWSKELYQILIFKEHRTKENQKGLIGLAQMFGKADYGVRKALDEIKYNKFKLGEPLLKIIFPILEKRDEKESAYKAFSNYLSNANYQFLIKQFEKEISISLRSAIILGIHKYNSPKNLNFILEQYEKKTVDASSVIIALSTFRQKKATTVLWNHFEKFGEYDNSRLARQSLIKIGVSEKKIEQKMSQILRTTENPSVIKSIIKHFSELQNYFLYPEPKSVLIKSKLVLKQSRIDELAYPVSRLTAPLHSKKISKIIIEYLNSSDRKLQEFAVVIINRYLTSFDFLVDWKAYENMIERLFEIQNEENGFNKKISNCLGNLLAHIKKPFLLDRIIKAGNETEKEETIINIISALRKNLPLFINHQNLIDFLLKHVHSKNRILRIGVVRHLIKMNSPKVIAEIEQLKSDKDPEIRNIISGKDEWYNTNYLEHYLQKEKKKEKANFTLSKKTKFFIEAKLKR